VVSANPNGVVARWRSGATPLGLKIARPLTQGSSRLATLGWRTQSLWDCRFESAPKEGRTALGFRFSEFYRSLVFKATPVQISLTPRFSGVWCARDGRKPFQRFPGLRGRNGPLADIADQEAPHR